MEMIRTWITGITAASILIAVICAIVPKNATGGFVRAACAVVLIIAVLAPLKSFRVTDINFWNTQYHNEFNHKKEQLDQENQKMKSSIIENTMSTYIWKRAKQIGIDCKTNVRCRKSKSGELLPYEVEVLLTDGTKNRAKLTSIIEHECGIPKDRQMYKIQERGE